MGTTGKWNVLAEIANERLDQDIKWGEQNHPDGTYDTSTRKIARDAARQRCDDFARHGAGTWEHILMEETMEAFAEPDPIKLRTELVQVAAVAVAWIEAIDRRTK